MSKNLTTSKNLTVTKANELIDARCSMSLISWRLLLLAVAKIDTQDEQGVILITGKEFSEWYGVSSKNGYKQLKEALKDLKKATFKTKKNENRPTMDWDWVVGRGVDDEKGRIGLCFSEKVMPFLTDISVTYTSYLLSQIAKLSLPGSMHLFQLLARFKKTGYLVLSLTDYRRIFDLKDGEYRDFRDLRKRLIEPLVEEINRELPSINLEWKGIKRGRSFNKLEFTYTAF